jgi:tRNA threonylcarbamoyl adenosine modification protein YeaZ
MILAVDTSTPVCSVALTDHSDVVFSTAREDQHVHVQALAPYIETALEQVEARGATLEALAVAIGPGSFNGLRIGLATVKAFAWARKLPLIPIPSTDALAHQLKQERQGSVRIVVYSHRNFLHYGDYHLSDGPIQTPGMQYATIEAAFSSLSNWAAGDARGQLENYLAEQTGFEFIPVKADAAAVGLLAAERMSAATFEYHEVEPQYNAIYEARKWVPPDHSKAPS